jgi:hypothetical protein
MAKKATKKAAAAAPAKLVQNRPGEAAQGCRRVEGAQQGGRVRSIGDLVGVHRRDVAAVFAGLGALIKADLGKAGSGAFKVPGLMRITVKRKPATKARMGINPFTKEQVMLKAKPARNVVRVRPLAGLKEIV